MRHLYLLTVIFALFIVSCGQQANIATYDSYFPLIAGRVITYEVTSYSDDGISPPTTITTRESWIYVGSVTLEGGMELFRLDLVTAGNTSTYYYREDSTGFYYHGIAASPTTEAMLVLKYPLAVGATWESELSSSQCEVLAEEDILTAAGNFTCRKVSETGLPGSINYKWYAKDVGMVSSFYLYGGAGMVWTSKEAISMNF